MSTDLDTTILYERIDGHIARLREAETRLDNQAEEIEELRCNLAACATHVGELRWQANITNERLTHLEMQEKAADTDHYVELRRALLVIGLTEILAGWHHPELWTPQPRWETACAELHRRYGHLQVDGKPLWSKPPASPSPETRALITEALRCRQEA